MTPMWSNFHTHTHYCDGKGTVRDYLEICGSTGVDRIGFSSHAPLPFPCPWSMKSEAMPQYREEIRTAAMAFPTLEVYAGLEVDYIPGAISPDDFANELDFTIGSVHFVGSHEGKHWEIDNTQAIFREGLVNIFSNDIRAAVSAYYDLTRQMVRDHPPDILGHLDKIKVNAKPNGLREEDTWYRFEVEETLRVIQAANVIVEVNTRGLYKRKSDSTYPSRWILERIMEMGIPITLSSDAHHSSELTREFSPTTAMLHQTGFRNISILKNGSWTTVSLSEYGSD